MSAYATANRQPPKVLTELEQRALLRASGEHKDGFRDHVIFSTALGTALRETEILALDVGDVFDGSGKAKRRVQLRTFKRSNQNVDQQEVFLPDTVRYKLEKFYRWKKAADESLAADAPVFVSREGHRLSQRMLRHAFATWQKRAGLDRRYTFHSLRHTALTNLYRSTRDIRLVQRAARHASIQSTTIYAGPSDDDVARAVQNLPC